MKTIYLYYVYDNVGSSAITGVIPAQNHLVAALGFKNAYIDNKDPKANPYNYKGLTLCCIENLKVDSDGCFEHGTGETWEINGADIPQFIADEFKARGIDDGFVEEPKEEE